MTYGQHNQPHPFEASHQPQPNPQPPKYDMQRLATNLATLTILGGTIAFAAIFLVEAIVATFQGLGLPTMATAAVLAGLAALIGLAFGLVYLPIDGTGNESLYKAAIIALAVVAIVVYGLLGGLVQGDWNALTPLTVIISAAVIATMAPRRIEDAANY